MSKECENCKYKNKCACYDCSRLNRKDLFEPKTVEIRPENPEEVWKHSGGCAFFTWRIPVSNELRTIDGGGFSNKPLDKMIHGKNGWTREFPRVEDDSVERVEVGVTCVCANNPMRDNKSSYQFEMDNGYFERLEGKKVILELPKFDNKVKA